MGVTPYEYFVFDGKPSLDFGVWISGGGTFDAPARDLSMISVPGRNGDLTFDNGRFVNISVTYPAFISRRFQPRIDGLRAWLCSRHYYCRLEDSYHPDEYRMAIYKSGLNVATTARNLAGAFDLTFDCKPQRFLKSGDVPVTFASAGSIYNPTEYEAKPIIRCNGSSGTVVVNGVSVSVTGCSAYVDIDCELMECYEGSTSRNMTTTLTDGKFPVLSPGENAVTFAGFTSVVITPKWWQI